MNTSEDIIYRYWGKAQPDDKSGQEYHLLPYHCLDVAAVGSVLLSRHQPLLHFFADNSGLKSDTFQAWMTFFLCLHDLGKFSESFQGLQEDILFQLQQKKRKKEYEIRHDSLGFILWRGNIADVFYSFIGQLHDAIQDDQDYWTEFFEVWAQVVTGHHGQPPKCSNWRVSRYFVEEDIAAANEFVQECMSLFLKGVCFVEPWPVSEWLDRIRCLSWWLAGFSVICDWLGSNKEYFAYQSVPCSLKEYWHNIALPSAKKAVESIGILPLSASENKPITSLFDNIKKATPLQKLSETVSLSNGPQLFILEDVTGAGKTEAAFLLLNRMMSSGMAEGAYIALPTMATANAMYARTRKVYQKLYKNSSSPSLVLAHGARHMVDSFRESVFSEARTNEADYSYNEETASTYCNAWLADNNKKALLAHMGVGTIDQALLAILQSRFQSLRLLGLRGKVLIVDEVHASDAYMHRLLQTLLTFHAASGGSAILLSATLPKQMRQELQNAFSSGLRIPNPVVKNPGYPLFTQISMETMLEKTVNTRQELERTLSFTMLHDNDEVFELIVEKANGNNCIAWVRNTVADALEAYNRLIEIMPENRVILFHARFALGDRLAIEKKVLSLFGKSSSAKDRAGKVVIATQVIEQSLDIDFDWMISDLAPIDLLIQRAGRLRRHLRDKKGNPINGKIDERGNPNLYVLSPDPIQEPTSNWFSKYFPKAAKVYPDHGRLWLTAHFLLVHKSIEIPHDMRCTIEAIYGEKAEEIIPENLLEKNLAACADNMVQNAQAIMNAIDFGSGYSMPDHEWWDETVAPTRLGEPTVTLRLAKWENGKLKPWADASMNAWSLSEVRVYQKKVKFETAQINSDLAAATERVKSTWPGLKKTFCIFVPMIKERDWVGEALDENKNPVKIRYSMRFGLEVLQ